MGNDYLVNVIFSLQGERFEIETAFTSTEVNEFMTEFECSESHAVNGLSRVYLLEHFGRDAQFLKAEYRRGYRK